MTQNVLARYVYEPFGRVFSMSGPLATDNLYRFSTKEFHAASSLAYYLRRYYDANLETWVNRDPIEEETDFHLYRFVYNNPVNHVDAEGLQTTGIATPGLAGVLMDEAAIEAAKIATAKAAARAAALAALATSTSFCPKPDDPCDNWDKLRKLIRNNEAHNKVLVGVSNVIKAGGSQADLGKVPGLTPELRALIGALYQMAADCMESKGRKDTRFNEERAKFLRGERPNAPRLHE